MTNITMIYQSTGRIPTRIGNRYESTYPYDAFPAKDGYVTIAAGNNKLFKILCDVMGRPELTEDPLYREVKDRAVNHATLREIICGWVSGHTVAEVDEILNSAGCPASAVNTIDMLVKDPQIAGARGMFPVIDQPGIGELQITAAAQKLTRTKSFPRKAPPLLGEDNEKIYSEFLGLSAEQIAQLREKGAV